MGTQGECEVAGESSENPECIICKRGINTAFPESRLSFQKGKKKNSIMQKTVKKEELGSLPYHYGQVKKLR